jgi:hypothetical protein
MKIATMAIAMTFLLPGTWALAQTGTAGGPTSLSGTGPSNIGGQRPADLGNGAGYRTHHRRAMNTYYGAGAIGAGAAAVGTAAAVAATSPNWGWGGTPYQTGYYAGGPYYGGSVRGARAAYYGGYPSAAWGGVSSSDRDQYIKNLHDSGYDPKGNFNANGTIRTN